MERFALTRLTRKSLSRECQDIRPSTEFSFTSFPVRFIIAQAMAYTAVLLPGERLREDQLPSTSKSSKSLTIGPGLRYMHPSTVEAANAGTLSLDNRKNGVWTENNGRGSYLPAVGDHVIAVVHHSSVETYHCTISTHCPYALLGHLAFEGVTRKTRPVLTHGSVVYARVSQAHKYLDPELECVQPSTAKAEGLGELKGGMLFNISHGMARRLLMAKSRDPGKIGVLEYLGQGGMQFEVAVGRNGKAW